MKDEKKNVPLLDMVAIVAEVYGAVCGVLHCIICVFNHGTHATNNCVKPRVGVRVKSPMVVTA